MTISTKTRRYTLADLEHLPPPWDGTRYEIIDGELHVATQPSTEHQYATGQVTVKLSNWNEQSRLGVVLPGPGLIFADDDNAVPDAIWLSWERFRAVHRADRKLHGPPELVIEVLSPGAENEYRDRDAKLRLYSRRGVNEYWILDPETRRAEIFRRLGGASEALRLAGVLDEDDLLESPLLPEFRVRVGDLFFPERPGSAPAQR